MILLYDSKTIARTARPALRESSIEYYTRSPLTAKTLVNAACSAQTWREILRFHGELASDDYVCYVDNYYRHCYERYGPAWHYFDIVNVLYAAAKLIRPKRYLEIGVRRGRSVCTVARAHPDVAIHGFDLWVDNYAGMENPGERFVRRELASHQHRGLAEFIEGNSIETVPQYLKAHPDMLFDLITVDGDHSESGARIDLENVLPKLAPGGVLVFDDVAHPDLPHMLSLWRKVTSRYRALETFEFTDAGYGVAFAVNRGIR
jgi:predicted O-methyltransferase YrrM